MRILGDALATAQKSPSRGKVYLRMTFQKTGETDVVIEQDRILSVPSGEESPDSQKALVVFDNHDGYFNSLDFKGWTVRIERGFAVT